MKFKGIGFDYGGVIAGPVGGEFAAAVSTLLGVSLEEYKSVYRRHNTVMNDGNISWDAFWQIILEEMGKTDKSSELKKFLTEWPTHRINENIITLAEKLKSAGYKVGILSNNSLENLARMKQAGLEKCFDPIVVSAEITSSKPGPLAFKTFFKLLGVEPEECVFIDDGERNIIAVKELGSAGVLFTDYQSLVRDLSELGIEVS